MSNSQIFPEHKHKEWHSSNCDYVNAPLDKTV
jgi:hypothetical protein